jgi:DNA-binding transcriptional regulator PaaX
LGGAAISAVDLFDIFLSAGYGASVNRFEYERRRKEQSRRRSSAEAQAIQRYYVMLYKLRKQGLIARAKRTNGILYRITEAGKNKLAILKSRPGPSLPPAHYSDREDAKKFLIVAFDIPEHSKRKREWLRSALRNLGMQMIQKSVWMGKIKLPEDFLEDLKKLRIYDFVEIFEISKIGSLRRVG